jgi:hypothetical protein
MSKFYRIPVSGSGTSLNFIRLFIPFSKVFQELNNFSGVMQVLSCIESAAINRLQHTFVVSRQYIFFTLKLCYALETTVEMLF